MMNAGAYRLGDRIVLRLYRAHGETPEAALELHGMVGELAMWPNLPAPNAFARGRDPEHGVVAVTAAFLRCLGRRKIAAVIAHELGHIKHRDTLIMTVAPTLGRALSRLVNGAM